MHTSRRHPARSGWPRKLLVGAGLAVVAVGFVFAGPAAAQEVDAASVQANLDNVWVLLAGVLVIFMQPGFAMLEAGLTRAKSVANIMMKNLMDLCAGVIAFLVVGYAIAFGGDFDGAGKFIGADGFFLGDGAFAYGTLTPEVTFIFQVAFAATAATIVSGAMAERTKFSAYCVFSFIISLFIYPIVVRWQWGGGWLAQMDTPYHDFAGSSIVHMTGGVAAFWGARALGPRIGKYVGGKPQAILGHNMPYAILGCFILLFGWYGFNAGSELAADGAIGGIALMTTIAAAMGMIAATVTTWIKFGKPDVGMAGNGLLAGLVGITAGCAAVTEPYAMVIGAVAGVLVVFSVDFIERVLKVDDPVGAISVHGVCGAWGVLSVGLFASQDLDGVWKQGLLVGGNADQLVSQIIGIFAILIWVSVTSLILFAVIKATMGLRVSEEEELAGLDILEHGSPGYGEGFGTFRPTIAEGNGSPTADAASVMETVNQ
jgi:Amt family ammonium transporter